jgi:multidrug efflux pump
LPSSSSLIFVYFGFGATYLFGGAIRSSRPVHHHVHGAVSRCRSLLSLWYFNQTINIFSQIGMIMLIGGTKNGILIVEFNQRKPPDFP